MHTAFVADEDKTDLSAWLYNGTLTQPGDLGYWVGYRIVKSYYDHAHDKRRALREMANGEPVRLIHFRAGDFWSEVADEFNAVAARVQLMEKKISRLEAALLGEAAVTNESPAQDTPSRGDKPDLKLVVI